MKKVSCSVEGNLGILKNQIYESQLDIEWLIKEIPHIKDPKLLHEVKRWLGKRQIGLLSVKIQENLNKKDIRDDHKEIISSIPKKTALVPFIVYQAVIR